LKKKILHVINSLTPGGAENLLVNSLSPGGLQEFTDNIVVYFQGRSPIADQMDKGVTVICLDYKGILDLPRALLQLRRIIKDKEIDIVHSHLNPAGFYTHLACPSSVPQVHTLHTTYSMDNETGRVKLLLEKHLYLKRRSCNLILLSEYTKDDFMRSVPFRGRSFVLNNFVPDRFFKDSVKEYGINNNSLRMVSAGRLNKVKNFEYLLEVFSHLKDREVYLDIYGNGDKTTYEKLIKERGLKVQLMGQHNDLPDVINTYDLFVLPSRFEGFPLSVFEAMASGVPLLISNIAPLKNVVGENAIYFDLDDDRSVADIIISILEKKRDINTLAKNARVYAEKTVRREMYLEKLLHIYSQL
jgi:glycosyltransferase involved in cell wall biosynthesis